MSRFASRLARERGRRYCPVVWGVLFAALGSAEVRPSPERRCHESSRRLRHPARRHCRDRRRVAAALTAAGLSAEARPVEDVKDIQPYDAVVLGGAAYMFHWLKPAVTFCRRHRKELAARPVWLFSSGPLGTDLVDKDGKNVLETAGRRSSTSSRSCSTRGVSRSSSAPTTRTHRRSVWASGCPPHARRAGRPAGRRLP